MKKGTIFLVSLLSAALTFGSLMAFVGPQHSGWNRNIYGWYGGWHHPHHFYDRDGCYDRGYSPDTLTRY